MLYLYASRNFSALFGLASPEPMANVYDPKYFRATWGLTALDAGFWTAMRIRSKWLRDIASVVFSLFYLVAAERADEKVRKVRGMLTVDHLRVSWNKGTTSPYLRFAQGLMRPRFTRWPPRQVRIPRPANSDYKDAVVGWLYFDGPLADLERHRKIVLDVPGGGFVAMDPRCNDDKNFAWAAKSGLPILSLDYKKAPEYPYPYALNECFDVYATLIQTRGKCIGMSGKETPRIIMTGDSAGANLAVAATLMILETSSPHFRRFVGRSDLPAPDGLVCFYPALDMNIGNWMTDEQMSLIRDRKERKTNRSIVRRKSRQYNDLVGTPHHSDEEDEVPPLKSNAVAELAVVDDESDRPAARKPHPEYSHSGPSSLSDSTSPLAMPVASPASSAAESGKRSSSASHHVEPMKTRLATSSMISYFNDRVLTPEMMRAMIILYIGPHNRPDFSSDYLLSPVLAPEALLAKFPKTYFMTGERDPLVDDTAIFAGRLRRAKEAVARHRVPPTINGSDSVFFMEELKHLGLPEVLLLPGTSHGFMQFPALYPPAWRHFNRSAEWFEQLYAHADDVRARRSTRSVLPKSSNATAASRPGGEGKGFRHHAATESSGDEDKPLEMTKITRGRGSAASSQQAKSPPSAPTNAGSSQSPPGLKGGGSGKKGKKGLSKNKSLVKLDSEEDLLSRRMQGLTSGLTGGQADSE